jgi:hypothetical protein
MTAQSSSNKSSQKKEDSGKNGTATGHQQAKHYSTGPRKSLNSSYMATKIPKHSYKVLPPRPPLTTPCGKLQKNVNQSRKLQHQFGRHKEHGHEAMLKKVSLRQSPCHCIPISPIETQLHSRSHPHITTGNPFPSRTIRGTSNLYK